jgi:hypothetical protein
MDTLRLIVVRIALLLFVILLGAQSAWLLGADLFRSSVNRLPTDSATAAAAAKQRSAAALAAAIGRIRGDLWADSAFTYADLLWATPDTAAVQQLLTEAHMRLDRALGDAPHNAGAWLLLAALSSRYPSAYLNTDAALKMSYYTGPSEQKLIPLRLRVAAHSDFVRDFEMRQFVSRDLHLLVARKDKSAITAAYNAASPDGKTFIEHTVGDVDPSAVQWLRAAVQSPQ